MKITKLKYENFKCFKNLELELGKLTLLTGANSSGKSSVIYGILAALQSGEFPFQLSPNGKYVEMGNFQDISYNHIRSNLIQMSFTVHNNEVYDFNIFWKIDNISKLPTLNRLKVSASFFNLEIVKEKSYNLKFEYNSEKAPHSDLIEIEYLNYQKYALKTATKNQNESENAIEELNRKLLQYNNHSIDFSFNDFSNLGTITVDKRSLPLLHILNTVSEIFTEIDKQTNYISSFRLHPERAYYEQTKTNLKVRKFGEGYTDQLIQWQTKRANEYKKIIKYLKDIELLTEMKSKRLEGGRYELLVKPNKGSELSSLADVGFGISQFLPILVADLQLSNDSQLFVSQPEIHLHPSVQANFADYLINQIKTSNKSYIIETHSEYLINRLRLGIVKQEISNEDMKIYYFQNNGKDVENFPLFFTQDGQIQNAPDDFFKTYMIDVMDIAINAAK